MAAPRPPKTVYPTKNNIKLLHDIGEITSPNKNNKWAMRKIR